MNLSDLHWTITSADEHNIDAEAYLSMALGDADAEAHGVDFRLTLDMDDEKASVSQYWNDKDQGRSDDGGYAYLDLSLATRFLFWVAVASEYAKAVHHISTFAFDRHIALREEA